MSRKIIRFLPPQPPSLDQLPLINAESQAAHWLNHYWRKLGLPAEQAHYLALTDDRREFARWTGRRLNTMALGCYCYLPLYHDDETGSQPDLALAANPTGTSRTRAQLTLPGLDESSNSDSTCETGFEIDFGKNDGWELSNDYRHLIFIDPALLPEGVEVTIAHELIHLADRISGRPRKHHCHGHDSISMDEAALTGRDQEWLRELLAEETRRREQAVRKARPFKYMYVCPNCGKEYPRVRKYSRAVSCGQCDHRFNAAFLLQLRPLQNPSSAQGATGGADPSDKGAACP